MKLLARLWNETDGAILSAEIMLVATILVIGVIVGLKSVRDSVVTELADVAEAVGSASQKHHDHGNHNGWDKHDRGNSHAAARCVTVYASAQGES